MRRSARLLATTFVALLVARAAVARESSAVLLSSNRHALAARAQVILGAKREINASAFIFTGDRLGQMGLAMLRAKVRQGVKVRLLVDPIASPIPRALLQHLIEEGVEVRHYNPARWRMLAFWRLNRRMHDKLLEADGEEMIVGGRNFTETYFGLRGRPRTMLGRGWGPTRQYRDLDAWVKGEAAADAQRYFHEVFAASHVLPPRTGGVTPEELEQARDSLDHYDRLMTRPSFLGFLRSDWRAASRKVTSAEFVRDEVPLGARGRRTIERWSRLFASAEREIVIVSPYFIPTRKMKQLVREAIGRGVRVKLYTNSRGANEALVQAAYEVAAPGIAKLGVEIHEYDGPEMMHAKAVLVDGRRAYVGSYNVDPRSQKLNSETGVILESDELGADLRAFVAELEKGSRLVARGGHLDKRAWKRHPTLVQRVLWPVLKAAMYVPGVWGQL